MNFDQIMKLIDAGFTKEEIMGFSAQMPPKQEPTQEPKPADNQQSDTQRCCLRRVLHCTLKHIPTGSYNKYTH